MSQHVKYVTVCGNAEGRGCSCSDEMKVNERSHRGLIPPDNIEKKFYRHMKNTSKNSAKQ